MSVSIVNKSLSGLLLGFGIISASFYNGPATDIILLPIIWSLVMIVLLLPQSGLRAPEITFPTDFLSIFIYIFAGYLLLSYQFSPMKSLSIYSTWQMGLFPGIYFGWKYIRNKTYAWSIVWSFILLTGFLSALYGIYDTYEVYISGEHKLYVNGQRLDPNSYAALLNAILIPAIFYFVTKKEKVREYSLPEWFLATSIYLMLVSILLTDSRAIILISTVLQLMLVAYLFKEKLLSKKIYYYLIILSLAFVTYFLLTTSVSSRFSFNDLQTIEGASWKIRLLLWKSTWAAYELNPVLGTGFGTFRVVYPRFRSAEETITSGDSPHNDYLLFLMEGGPLPLLYLLALGILTCYFLLILFFRKKHNFNEKYFSGERFSFFLVILGLMTHAIVNFVFSVTVLIMLAGLYLARGTDYPGNQKTKTLNLKQPVIIKSLSILVITIALASLFTDAVFANIFNQTRNQSITSFIKIKNEHTKFNIAKIGSIVRPNNTTTRYAMLTFYFTTGTNAQVAEKNIPNEIENILDELERLHFYSESPSKIRAGYYRSIGKFKASEKYYAKALTKNPWDTTSYIGLAKTYHRMGYYDKAIKLLMNEAKPKALIDSQQKNRPMLKPLLQTALKLAIQENKKDDEQALRAMLKTLRLSPRSLNTSSGVKS